MADGQKNLAIRSVIAGTAAAVILFLAYFSIVSLAQDFSHAVQTFKDLRYWITALVGGFGIQGGLYYYIRSSLRAKKSSTASVAACGGMSTTAMAACCAHHLSDVLPILGLSAAAAFLAEYQVLFILIGVLSNFVGVVFMLRVIQEHALINPEGRFAFLFRHDLKKAFRISVAAAIIIFLFQATARINPG